MAENPFSRKLDSMGRIMIPSKIREQMELKIGEEYTFSTMEKNNHKYICIDCGPVDEITPLIKLLELKGYMVLPPPAEEIREA